MQFIQVGGLVVAGVLNVMLGLIIQLHDVRRASHNLFLFLSINVAIWNGGIALFIADSSPARARTYANVYYIAALGISYCLYAFATSWSSNKRSSRHLTIPALIFLAFALSIALRPSLIVEQVFINGYYKSVSFNAAGQSIYSILFLSGFAGALWQLIGSLRTSVGYKRAQLKLMILGIGSAGALGMALNLVLPWFGHYRLIWIGPQFSVLFVGCVAYAIVKHRLFDIRLAVARGLAYVGALGSIVCMYSAVVFGLLDHLLSHTESSVAQRAVYVSLAVITALLFPALKTFFDGLTDKLFFRDAYSGQDLLDRLNKILVRTIELELLLRQSAELIATTLKASYTEFVIDGSGRPQRIIGTSSHHDPNASAQYDALFAAMHAPLVVIDSIDETSHPKLYQLLIAADVSAVVRLTTHTGHVGYLLLGAKQSGNTYTSQDTALLDIMADELAIAAENALRFEEIEHFNLTLQEKVEHATQQLRRANQRLKTLDETKDDFISMASHQLRTPLTSVKGYVSMVLDGDVGKITTTQRKLLDQSFASAQRMVYLISDLLNVSRLKTGKFVIESSPVNLADVVEGEVSQLAETATSRKLELAYVKPEHFPTLMLDETKIRQVIMNFIDNAIYYTPSGGHIRVELVDKPSNVELTVSDNGIGVPATERQHLFTKFYRAGNARRARPDGTGLGLFMAQKVIVAQGGAVIFTSEEGKGSTFGFTFAKAALQPPSPLSFRPMSRNPAE